MKYTSLRIVQNATESNVFNNNNDEKDNNNNSDNNISTVALI